MRGRPRLGSAVLEQLLEGAVDDGTALAGVLAAAQAAGTPAELTGLDAARAAFVATHVAEAALPRPSVAKLPAVTRTTAGRLLALKAIAAVSGATLVGGVAYAASGARLLGGSHHTPAQHTSGVPGSSAPGGVLPPGYVYGSTAAGHSTQPHPSRATTPDKGRGASITASVRVSHTPSRPAGGAPTPSVQPTSGRHTPTSTPSTSPPEPGSSHRPTGGAAGTHSAHPTPPGQRP
jgi:hypothetical protein